MDDFDASITSRSNVNQLPARPDMRTFVFSATMSKELQTNLKRKGGQRKFVPRAVEGDITSLDDLLDKLDFRDPDPEIIDLSPEHGLVETLKECKVECLQNEKVGPSRFRPISPRRTSLTVALACRTSTCTTSLSGIPLGRSFFWLRSTEFDGCTRCSNC